MKFKLPFHLLIVAFSFHSLIAVGEEETVENLDPLVAKHLNENPSLPSLAAVVIVDGKWRGQGVAGVRKQGAEVEVTIHDKYHIGSCSKAFTATLAARLVEEELLSWETSIEETLSQWKPELKIGKAQLHQLVTNTGGFPKEVPPRIWKQAWKASGDSREQRSSFVKAMMKNAAYTPGEEYEYSNTGFSVAGAMMEEATDKSWEELIDEKIFQPLGMKSAGFYAPATDQKDPDQPWGHRKDGTPVPPGPGSDNPAAIAPAGAIHCSLPDLVPWMTMHLQEKVGPVLREEKSFERLHTPVREGYAMGWIVGSRPWAGGKALTHMGSNTMFTTVIWIAPEKNFAVAVATNIGHEVGFGACDGLIGELIQTYLP